MIFPYHLRPATSADAPIIARHRGQMFLDMGSVSPTDAGTLIAASEPWIADVLAKGEYLGWVIEIEDRANEKSVIAGAGLHLRTLGPAPGCLRLGRWAHIANVYTEPTHRRLGLGRLLLTEILAWCASNQIDQVTLAASADGRALYESLGFVATDDMRLRGNSSPGEQLPKTPPLSIPRT